MFNKEKNMEAERIKDRIRLRQEGGYALITALIFFLSITTAVLAGLSDSVLREVRVVRQESSSKQSYFAAESAIEDITYRIKKTKQVPASGTLVVASSSADFTTSSSPDGVFDIIATADQSGTQRKISASVEAGVGASFNYAVQAGTGGIDLNSSTITGDAYTTGSIRALGASSITGAAIAAGKSFSNEERINDNPIPPTMSITFGNNNVTQDSAQSFTISQALSVTDLQIYVRKTGNPANATVRIVSDAGGSPSGTTITSGTLSSSFVGVSYSWQDIVMNSNPVLSPGTTYWLVIDGNSDPSSYYIVAANSTFIGGTANVGNFDTNTWYDTSPSNLDQYFKVYIGANQSGITGESQASPLSVNSAYAYNVANVSASDIIYCQIGTNNNKACDTSRSDPAIQAFPVTDAMISNWKSAAATGDTHSGNYSVGPSGDTLGPKKIEGNLTVNGGGTLYISGSIWVTGSVTIVGNSTVSSADTSKSYVIIADGGITVSGGATITGVDGSHIMLVSTSSADPAINITGGSNNAVFFAPNGGLTVGGGASAKAAAAYHLVVSNNSTVTYDPDMSQLNFSAGGIGGPAIKSWKEIE